MMDDGFSALLHSIILPVSIFYPLQVIFFLTSCFGFVLPFLLTPSDSFSRRSILLLSTLFCFISGVLLSSSFFSLLITSIAISTSLSFPPFLPLLLFVIGLLTIPTIERSLLLIASHYVKRQRAREAEEEEEAAHQRAWEEEGEKANGGGKVHRGRRDPPNPLLPPPVKDYRQKRPLDELSEEEEFEYDDRDDPLSPPLFSSSSLLAHPSSSTSYHTLGIPSVDAASFISNQRYIARCAFCKENVPTRKALAYHSAGCPLKHLPAFTIASHSLASLRGKRQMTLDDQRIPPHILTWIALWEILCLNTLTGLAVSMALEHTALIDVVSDGVTTCSLMFFLCFTSALQLRQQRAGVVWTVVSGGVTCLTMPCVSLLYRGLGMGSVMMEVVVWACLGGVLLWISVVDVLLEEMERKDAKEAKWISFVVGFVLMTAINVG